MTHWRVLTLVLVTLAVLIGCARSGLSNGARTMSSGSNQAATVNMQLALGYFDQGKLEVALEKITRALEADPKFADAHTVAAVIYEQIGENDTAARHYSAAVRYAPKDGDAQNNYGTFLCKTGKLAEAEKHFLQAVESTFYQTPEVALTNAGNCVSKVPNLERAQEYYRRALQYNPQYADALFQLASVQQSDGQCLQARGLMQRFESIATHSAESLELAADIEDCNGDRDAAQQYRDARKRLR